MKCQVFLETKFTGDLSLVFIQSYLQLYLKKKNNNISVNFARIEKCLRRYLLKSLCKNKISCISFINQGHLS